MKRDFSTILLVIAICVYMVGMLFKLTHWQYGDELRLAGAGIAVAGFVLLLIKSRRAKQPPNNDKLT